MAKRYWLFKSEPDVYSFRDLQRDKKTMWEGVRNYQARNILRDEVQLGDNVLYYHSRVKPMEIAGVAKVVKTAYPDPTQFDSKSKYFDPKAQKDAPRWIVVDIAYDFEFKKVVTRDEMQAMPELGDMMVLKRGARLSVQPVSATEFRAITKAGGRRR